MRIIPKTIDKKNGDVIIGNGSHIFAWRNKAVSDREKYKTKQKELLLDYFEKVPHVHVTAADVCDYFRGQGASIGQSTIYRRLERLVDEGVLKKYTIDAGTPACFEYVGESGEETTEQMHIHCKCEKCGDLIHLHCDEMTHIQQHLLQEHQFKVNPVRTVIYGLCENCI